MKVAGTERIPSGDHQVRVEFAYDGGGLGKGGTVTLFVDGQQVGSGRQEASVPMLFSADETCDIGRTLVLRSATTTRPRTAASRAPSTGCSSTPGSDDHDHLITPEERPKIAMARQ